MKIVIDTSIVIDFSRSGRGLFKNLIKGARENRLDLYVSTISVVEFWAGQSMKNKLKVAEAENIFSRMITIPLDEKIAKTAGELIRNDKMGGFDSIIAATALEIGAQVATNNTKHFSKIKDLKTFEKIKE